LITTGYPAGYRGLTIFKIKIESGFLGGFITKLLGVV
jgi:hypothetical protein